MKAAVYYKTGSPEVLQYEDVADPVCAPDGVSIAVEAISIEGGDVGNRARGEMPKVPHIVGYQCGGTILEVGAAVRDRKVGERVVAIMMHCSHAERVAVPAGFTFAVPEGLAVEVAACADPVRHGRRLPFEFGRLQGETVRSRRERSGRAVQLAKRAGATVIATTGSDEKLARLRDEFGLDHGVNYRATRFVDAVREITRGRGCELVVDSVGGATLQGSLDCLAYRGRCITVGDASREGKRIDVSSLAAGNRSLTGVFLGAETVFGAARVRSMIEGHLRDVAKGALRVVIDRRFPLAEAAAAHAHIESRSAFGRVVMIP
jgi:NADPH2:quinone reductase